MSKQVSASFPVPTFMAGLLGVAFIVLKLCGIITWSWWLVLLPFYAPLALIVLAVVIGALVALLVHYVRKGR